MRYLPRLFLVLAVAVLLASCASEHARRGGTGPGGGSIHLPQQERYRLSHDGAPVGTPQDISKLPEPVPRVEPRSPYGNKSPYTVDGHTYHVLATARGYDARGEASWYGRKFQGYMTSSMEPYDVYKFTAASKVLPLPSYARVTNLDNGKSVIVRVNDRGPFVPGRIIDLSYAAAVRIGIWPKGTGRVEVEAIVPGAKPPSNAPAVAKHVASGHGVWLQVGAFASKSNARDVARRLRQAGLKAVQLSEITVAGHQYTRVRLGPLKDASQAGAARSVAEQLGLSAFPVGTD